MTNEKADLLETKIDDLKEFINYRFNENKEDHNLLWTQVKTTNGSVKDLKLWKWMLAGAWGVVTVLFPLLAFYYSQNEDYKIDKAIQESLEKHIQQGLINNNISQER